MFTISGIGIVSKEDKIIESQIGTSIYISFVVVTKDPYKNKRHHNKISLQVPMEFLEKARESIKPGKGIQIRLGELTGYKGSSGYISASINTKWKWIEPIKALPNQDRKEYQDI